MPPVLNATQKIIKQARALLDTKDGGLLKDFLDVFCEYMPETDIRLLSPHSLLEIVKSHWDLLQKRKGHAPAIKIYAVKTGGTGANATRTAIDIVNDDMSFLVDSIAAELTAHNRPIQVLLHPILQVQRSKNGALSFTHGQAEKAAGFEMQSHIHIELQGSIPDSAVQRLEEDLLAVLNDVKAATRDWPAMKERLRDVQRTLRQAPVPDDAIEEYLSFLDYLYRDNFTLLGYRAYRIEGAGPSSRTVAVKGSGLGLLSDAARPSLIEDTEKLSPDMQALRMALPPLTVSKLKQRSTVHRAVPLDAVTVKQYDDKGQVTGEAVFIGLFTSVTYSRSIQDIPFLRRKADNITQMSGFRPGSHDYKALRHILEKYPRDELLQMPDQDLLETALSILQLQERHRIALYTRPDPLSQYISCLVYVPRERYDTRLRETMQRILEQDLGGLCGNFYTTLDDSPLARVMYLIYIGGNAMPKFDREAIERRLQSAGRVWGDRLQDALREAYDDENLIAESTLRYARAFPAAYSERYEPKQTVYDIAKIERALQDDEFALDLYHDKSCDINELRLKIYNRNRPIILSDALPILENLGLRVISELPYEVRPQGADNTVWIHDFLMRVEAGHQVLESVKDKFEDALKGVWAGRVENDSLNQLVIHAGMDWPRVQILRAYVRYLRQAQYPFGTLYIERALTQNPAISDQIVNLFYARLQPGNDKKRDAAVKTAADNINAALEKVISLDVDRILRTITSVVQATLRTNFFQVTPEGHHKPHLSIKLDSRALTILPDPKPFREIFVYSPRMEGIHLRMDWIARGGIRWSDRAEDFRTEVLGLMKAQQVKNAVIVPMGAKGGFIVKNPPKTGGRDAFQKEGIECYKILIRGLLDITDNRRGKLVVPPVNVVRHDQDDPYLVVAADKGTATFSDIANALSIEYGHWLGDAFASGGSAGYDHKKMGITARGAWESVKRHFREMDHDTQSQPFDVIGVGDMAGDVFGNGMLQSDQIRLVGCFNHVHIVCDPTPDPKASFKERQRLFNEVKGWDQYDLKKLSKGGRIYSRSDKSLQLTPEIKARFGLTQDKITPAELIQVLLRAETDLLFFGGIGTYLKATSESQADVGDKTNDALRIDAPEVRAKVIGEGANLALTQKARIELALNDVRLNTDFIDNSAGVDTSDHEVNIKILLQAVIEQGGLNTKKRNVLLQSMTEEVAALVLRDNYQQAQGLSLAEMQAASRLAMHAAFITDLEVHSALNRKLEGLPDKETLQKRRLAGQGLTRPELSVLLAHAKILFTKDLLVTDIPDHPDIENWLVDYFPTPLRKKYAADIRAHRLHREIIATALSNELVNRMGPTFVKGVMDKTGASSADVARAWLIVRDAFGLPTLWAEIEALDARVPARVQLGAMQEILRMIERETVWFLTRLGQQPDISRDSRDYGAGIAQLQASMDQVATPDLADTIRRRFESGLADGLPRELAQRIAVIPAMGAACDILRIARDSNTDIPLTARTYFELGDYFRLPWLRQQARLMPANDRWTTDAVTGLVEQLHNVQSGLTSRVLKDGPKSMKKASPATSAVASWLATSGLAISKLDPMIAELHQAGTLDLPMLMLAEQRLRQLSGG